MPQFKRHPLSVAILMACAGPQFVAAQSETVLPEVKVRGERESFDTDSTRSATRTETPLRDIPQTINVVPQQVIESQGARSLTDALRNVPGITYTAPEGGTQAAQLFWLRGFPSGGDLFLDGVHDIGEYNRDLFAVEAVEVLKGPSALAFGRGSTGGVINQVSKYADLLPRKELALSLGSNGEKRLTGDVNLRLGDRNALRLIALGEDSETYRDTIDNNQIGVAPSLRFGVGAATDITLSYYYLKTEGATDYGQPNLGATFNYALPPVSLKKYYGLSKYDFTDWDTNIATLRIDHQFNDSVSLRNTLRWASYKREMEATIANLRATDANGNPVTQATPLEELVVTRTHNKARDTDDEVLINQTDLIWKVATGAIKHTVLGGLSFAHERLNRRNFAFDSNPATAAVEAPISITPLLDPDSSSAISYTKTPQNRNLSEADTAALYAQDQLEFSRQWKAIAGLRWDHYDASTEQTAIGPNGTNAGPFSRTDDYYSGRAGLIWQPSDAQSYYLSWSNSYNPSGELGVYGASATNLNATNDDLKPEENYNYELGAQWDLLAGVQLRAALFRNEKTNARITDPIDGTVRLEGERRVDGVELSFAGRVTRSWDIYGAYAYMDGEIVKSGNPLTEGNEPLGVPYHSGTLWTLYRLGGGWELGGGAFASSEWWLDDQNRAKAPSYVRWDATLAYVQRRYDVRLNVFNIFDEKYYIGAYQNNPTRVLPGQPFTALVTARYRF